MQNYDRLSFTYTRIFIYVYGNRSYEPKQATESAKSIESKTNNLSVTSAPSFHFIASFKFLGKVLKQILFSIFKFRRVEYFKNLFILCILITDKDDQQTKVTSMQRTTIPGLRKYTNYSITVLAYTARGDGVRSDPIYCQTEEDGKLTIFYAELN